MLNRGITVGPAGISVNAKPETVNLARCLLVLLPAPETSPLLLAHFEIQTQSELSE